MARPARLVAALLAVPAAVAMTTVPATAAHATTDLGALRAAVLHALSGSTAAHAELRADVAGLGQVAYYAGNTQPPASNEKLLTAETALQQLGAGYHYLTDVYGTARIVNHTIAGNLVIRGSGDPTLRRADLASLAGTLERLGLRRVTGDVVILDGRYVHSLSDPGWKPGFVPDELGPVDAFSVDEDAWRTDGTYLNDPGLFNGGLWRTALSTAGITAAGPTVVVRTSTHPLTLLASHASGPMSSILDAMLTDSVNYYAEMILDELGYVRAGTGDRYAGTWTIYREADALRTRLGGVYDGSGLSYDDSESPNSLVGWLEASARSSTGRQLRAGLPVSCETGTLVGRLCGSWLTGRIQAKTGTLTGIRTLSGYTTTRSGRAVTFSVLLGGIANMTTAQQHLDAAVAVLARWTG